MEVREIDHTAPASMRWWAHKEGKTMKTKIEKISNREVRLAYTDDGDNVERIFWIPSTESGRGYVRERTASGNDPQVCDALFHRGNTLTATPETLLQTIRREWKAWRREMAKLNEET